MSKTKVVLKNIGFGMLYKPISVFISFIVVPITISYLGEFNYGLWATILSIISWISFFDIGIGNGLRNHLAIAITMRDFVNARKFIATSYIVIAGISTSLLIVLGILTFFIDWQTVFNVSKYSNEQIRLILLTNLVFICVNFILRLVTTIYFSLQRSSIIGVVQILNQIFNLLGVYLLTRISFSESLLGISLVYGVASIIVNIIYTWILFVEYKELRFKLIDFDIQKVGSLTDLGMQFFVIQLAGMIIFTTDNLIITSLFGPENVTPYNITFKVFNMLIILHTVIITPLWSAITQAYAEKDIKWIRKALSNLYVFQVILLVIILLVVLAFPYLIELWIGTKIKGISSLLILSFGLYALLSTWCNNYAYIFNGLGLIRLQLKVAVFQGIINIPLSILLANYFKMGITGVIVGTNLTLLIAAILYPIHLKKIFKHLDNGKRDEYDENITLKL